MASQNVDSFNTLLDFSPYDTMYQQSPLMPTPATSSKAQLAACPMPPIATPIMPSLSSQSNASISGPSHPYELFKQQTPFVPGAVANTVAFNRGMDAFGMRYLGTTEEFLHFDGSDMDFSSTPSTAGSFMFGAPDTVSPNAIQSQPTGANIIGRMWPGAHSQAAREKLLLQQQQQQHQQHQQHRQQQEGQLQQHQQPVQSQHQRQPSGKAKAKNAPPTDPLVEQKITQLLNSMRAKPSAPEDQSQTPAVHLTRMRKDEEDMDEDERLLASEEGKKLTSKERRQLRNKVSARAFRSRRKEYISQLEAEISKKAAESGELRSQNRALEEENKRLSDLTRMLLSSPSFSGFLDTLATNPDASQAQIAEVAVKPEPAAEQRQIPKDVNVQAMPDNATVDFPLMNVDPAGLSFQPQVFSVLEIPEIPLEIESLVLSGKPALVATSSPADEAKIAAPILDLPLEPPTEAPVVCRADAEFESDPSFALYHASTTTTTVDSNDNQTFDLGCLNLEKFRPRFQPVVVARPDDSAAMETVLRISESLSSHMERINSLFSD